MILVTVFVIPAALLCTVVLGALLIASCFALVFWMFTRDPYALRAFWMFSLRHIFGGIICAKKPRYSASIWAGCRVASSRIVPETVALPHPDVPIASSDFYECAATTPPLGMCMMAPSM
jgi:hypothetical protein